MNKEKKKKKNVWCIATVGHYPIMFFKCLVVGLVEKQVFKIL